MSKRLAKKVLLIGWDAADWKVINPLIEQGKMPALEKIINNGVMGNLATLDPPLSPMLWTSIATGKTADQHRILGFVQPKEDSSGLRPVLSTSRKVKAVWNMLSQAGLKSHIVGWWPSHPVEKINGSMVSNFYQKANSSIKESRTLPQDSVHPENLRKVLAELKIHPAELTQAHILPFVPQASKIDIKKDKRLFSIAKIVAETTSVHAAATYIMEREDWDFFAVYYDAIDHFGHGFMKFHPPYRKEIPSDLFNIYKDVLSGGYIFQDMMLERMITLAGEDATVIIVSDHGFLSGNLRPKSVPKIPAGPAIEHRRYGIVCMSGKHIRKDELVFGATLLDITPTILTLFGLPVGKDMRGKPLVQAFDNKVMPQYVDSWEEIPGRTGEHSKSMLNNPWAEQEAMKRLVDLGYIEPVTDENIKESVERSVRESKFYLARVFINIQKNDKALPLLEELYNKYPDERRYTYKLIQCYLDLGNITSAKEVVEKMISDTDKNIPNLDFLHAKFLIAEKKNKEAFSLLKKIEKNHNFTLSLQQNICILYFELNEMKKAEQCLIKVLSINEDNAEVHHLLARIYLFNGNYKEAVEHALTSVGLLHFNPTAHYHLGEALFRLGNYADAEKAFLMAVTQAPGMKKAHQKLVFIYDSVFKQAGKSQKYRRFIETNINHI